jgi:hypothetical protein
MKELEPEPCTNTNVGAAPDAGPEIDELFEVDDIRNSPFGWGHGNMPDVWGGAGPLVMGVAGQTRQ